MSEADTNIDKLAKRQEILDELWALVGNPAHPGSVAVAALDRIARIEDAYSPIKVERVKKYRNLADFYKGVGDGHDVTAGVESAAAETSVPVFEPTQQVEDDEEDGFL